MIERYAYEEMASLFSDEARFSQFLEVELLAVEAFCELGIVPRADAEQARARSPKIDRSFVEAVAEREKVTDHDVAAFVDVVQSAIGGTAGSWIHYGLTSTDVVDTALSVSLSRAAELLLATIDSLVEALRQKAIATRDVVMVGRTHGMHAEPTTFGNKLALFCLQVARDRDRLRRARAAIAVGKLSGAVGTYSNIDPFVEGYVCKALGLTPAPATQVLARDRHAEYLYALTSTATTIEAIATELRHLQRSEVAETEEPFRVGQKGSSAMPHKRNPVLSERLVGFARVMRGYLVSGLEDVALWHERDISHSSVERIILPDASMLCYYGLRRMTGLVEGLVVNEQRMRENLLEGSYGLVFSQPVLLSLVSAGLTRDAAYRVVQRDARVAFEQRRAFREVLEGDDEVVSAIGAERLKSVLDEAFDLTRSLRHIDRTFDAIKEL